MSGEKTFVAGIEGTHTSWYKRFECVAAALSSGNLSEEQAKECWKDARNSGLPAPDAYLQLVDHICLASQVIYVRDELCVEGLPKQQQPLDKEIEPEVAGVDAACGDEGQALPSAPKRWQKGRAAAPQVQWLPKWVLAPEGLQGASTARAEAPTAGAGATLWLGDIPAELAHAKRLNEVLHAIKPRHIPTPFIRKVVKKGYRFGAGPKEIKHAIDEAKLEETAPEETAVEEEAAAEDAEEARAAARANLPGWMGFAFVAFRDKAEAAEALQLFHGLSVQDWTINAQWADDRHQGGIKTGCKLGPRLLPGQDPPMGMQLFPSCLHSCELAEAVARHRRAVGLPGLDSLAAAGTASENWVLAEAIKACYRLNPRPEIHVQGQPVPERLLVPLLAELKQTRWPPAPHRTGMQAANYLVLHRGKINDGYEALLELLCGPEGLLAWADPDYGCNRVAVTRDFQGSPHIDASDVTYQYALSLGDFSEGGELCVEGQRPHEVYVVETHNRMARVDGRFVHWVRGHGGGDRYSIIFFATNPACATEALRPFHDDFVPHLTPGAG